MKPKLILLFLGSIISAWGASLEQDARALLSDLEVAMEAKDDAAAAGLFDDDALVILTMPQSGAAAGRFYRKAAFFSAWKERSAVIKSSVRKRTITGVTTDDTRQIVFVTAEAEERSRVDQRSEWIKSNEYWVLEAKNGRLRIKQLVSELVFYFPDVPLDVSTSTKK